VSVTGVVFVFEVGDPAAGVAQVGPVVAVEAFLAQPVVERFDERVAPRRAGRDVGNSDLPRAELLQRLGNHFRPVVHA
jgi:hypothetical protein